MSSTLLTLQQTLEQTFPRVAFAMAYGSGVFQQKDHDSSTSMIDLVFAVDDPVQWHKANLLRNSHHYSFVQYFGAERVAAFQEDYGAGVYYNTLVVLDDGKSIGNRLIKYGIVSTKTLCDDLYNWKTLYLSGRMHKPVGIMKTSEEIRAASSKNLEHALHYALLCLPEKFSETDLYMKIAGISYLGDFRMTFGENPKKVRNIVAGNFDAFQQIYQRKIENSAFVSRSISDAGVFIANTQERNARQAIVDSMPSNVLQRLGDKQHEPVTKKQLQRAVASIVKPYSRSQSIKGIATAGGLKTITYIAQKLQRTYFKK